MLKIRDISVSYGERAVLRDVSFELRDGQIINRRVKNYTNGGFPWENRTLQLHDGGNYTRKLMRRFTSNE